MTKKTYQFSKKQTTFYFDSAFTFLEKIIGDSHAIIVTDENVYKHHKKKFSPWKTIVLKAGEAHKQQSTVDDLLGQLITAGADRKTLLVGVGGGTEMDPVERSLRNGAPAARSGLRHLHLCISKEWPPDRAGLNEGGTRTRQSGTRVGQCFPPRFAQENLLSCERVFIATFTTSSIRMSPMCKAAGPVCRAIITAAQDRSARSC